MTEIPTVNANLNFLNSKECPSRTHRIREIMGILDYMCRHDETPAYISKRLRRKFMDFISIKENNYE